MNKVLGKCTDAGMYEEEHILNGKPIDIQLLDIKPTTYVFPGDHFSLEICQGQSVIHKSSTPIEKTTIIDAVAFFEFEDALGFKHGFCGAFGEKA